MLISVWHLFPGIFFTDTEITPSGVCGEFRFTNADVPVDSFPPEVEVRAVVEGQFMAKRYHAQSLGYQITPTSRVLVTGGGSQNDRIRQVCGVWSLAQANYNPTRFSRSLLISLTPTYTFLLKLPTQQVWVQHIVPSEQLWVKGSRSRRQSRVHQPIS